MTLAGRTRTTLAAVLVAATLAVALTGCRSHGRPSATRRAAQAADRTARSTPTTATPSPSPSLPSPCYAEQLRLTATPGDAQGDLRRVWLRLTNTASTPCLLKRPVTTRLSDGSSSPGGDLQISGAADRQTAQVLASGQAVQALLTYHAPGNGGPDGGWNPATVSAQAVGGAATAPWPGGPVARVPGDRTGGVLMAAFG